MNILIAFLFALTSVFATENDITHRPKSFAHLDAQAVFVDFEEAIYAITYNIDQKKAEVVARFKMHIVEAGYPIFDLIQEPTSITLDGNEVTASEI